MIRWIKCKRCTIYNFNWIPIWIKKWKEEFIPNHKIRTECYNSRCSSNNHLINIEDRRAMKITAKRAVETKYGIDRTGIMDGKT